MHDKQFKGWLSNQAGKMLRFCAVTLREGPAGQLVAFFPRLYTPTSFSTQICVRIRVLFWKVLIPELHISADHRIGDMLLVTYIYENKRDGSIHNLRDFIGLYEVEEEGAEGQNDDVGRAAMKYVPKTNQGDMNFSNTPLRPGLYQFR